jgi:anti-sigma factor RsiW
MEKMCEKIMELLVDYADGELPAGQASETAEHLQTCEHCRNTLKALQKSIRLAEAVWKNGLTEIQAIKIQPQLKARKVHWARCAAIAAGILIVITSSIIWHPFTKPAEKEMTFAQIERSISAEGNAKYPDAEPILRQQYRYIVETYPQTRAAANAKLKIK